MYRLHDLEGNQRVPKALFVDMLRTLGHVVSNEEARTLLANASIGETFSEDQFKNLMAAYFETGALSIPNADIFEEVKIFDQGNYCFDKKEFRVICTDYGEPLEPQQIEALMNQFADENGLMNFKTMIEAFGEGREKSA